MNMAVNKQNTLKFVLVAGFLSLLVASIYFTNFASVGSESVLLSATEINSSFALDLASNLKISERTATVAIGIILTTGDIITILSLLAVVLGGAGLVSAAMVATAKQLAKKYGKKYAAKW